MSHEITLLFTGQFQPMMSLHLAVNQSSKFSGVQHNLVELQLLLSLPIHPHLFQHCITPSMV